MGECVLCKEQITNPLSPQRLAEQMTTWMWETSPEFVVDFRSETKSFLNKDVHNDDFCIINGQCMDVCVYCFTEHIYRWLEQEKASPMAMKQYVKFFNFDITGGGYMKSYQEKYEHA